MALTDLEKAMGHMQKCRNLIRATLREKGDVDGHLDVMMDNLTDMMDTIDSVNTELLSPAVPV